MAWSRARELGSQFLRPAVMSSGLSWEQDTNCQASLAPVSQACERNSSRSSWESPLNKNHWYWLLPTKAQESPRLDPTRMVVMIIIIILKNKNSYTKTCLNKIQYFQREKKISRPGWSADIVHDTSWMSVQALRWGGNAYKWWLWEINGI